LIHVHPLVWDNLMLLFAISFVRADHGDASSEAYLSRLGILSQHDPALNDTVYVYRGHNFWENGCLPASVTNALTAAFSVDELDSAVLLRDVLVQMTPEHRPDLYAIELSGVASLFTDDLPEGSPALQQLSCSMTAVAAAENRLSGAEMVQQLTALGDSRVALMFTMSIRSNWERVLEITDALYNAGLPQARLTLCNMTLGIPDSGAPFHSSGKAGHYATLYFEAGEFHDSGAFYLLDSYPRALEGDSYSPDDALYREQYPFVSSRKFQAFNNLYHVTHVTPTVVKLALHAEALADLAELADQPEARTNLRLRQLKPVVFYGTAAKAFLVLP
ncbi:MAG: hypothetical protein ACI4MK_00530, partial [Aristaeellaceae bacterium]